MKRDLTSPDLRSAFPAMPDSCRSALTDAARSVQEEKKMKKATFRAVLIAAITAIVTTAVALAANNLGWVDFYQEHYGLTVPKAAEEALDQTEERVYEVGPLTVTVRQLLADGRIALTAMEARATDGSEALFCGSYDLEAKIAAGSDVIARRYGLAPETTWTEAAKQLELPLYTLRLTMRIDPAMDAGEAMEDYMFNEDGSVAYLNMPTTVPEAVGDELPATLWMRVARIDPATGEEAEKWIVEDPIVLPIAPVLAEKTYRPVEPFRVNGFALTAVRAELRVTGAYLFAEYEYEGDVPAEDYARLDLLVDGLRGARWADGAGAEYSDGMSLTGRFDSPDDVRFTVTEMITADALPDTLTLLVQGEQIALR